MANRNKYKMSLSDRSRRIFSEEFKKQKVREIESGSTRPSEVSNEYDVSLTSVRRWINKYGSSSTKQERLIVENLSDTKQLIELKKKVAELERLIGQKQILLDFKDKMIDIAEAEYGVDIKKKFSSKP